MINKEIKRKVTIEVKRRNNETIPTTLTRTVTLCGNSCHIRVPRNMAGLEVTIMIKKNKKTNEDTDKEIIEHIEAVRA